MAGAFIKTYLLEKSRSVAITDPERNYHIFYQLCAGAPDELKGAALSKLAPAQLRMLSQSKCITLSGKDDREDYEVTVGAMRVLGIPQAEQAELFRVLSALLLLGNVQYTQDDHDHAVFAPGTDAFVAAAEEMLQCGPLTRNLTSREMKAKEKGPPGRRSSFYTIEYTQAQAEAVRDAVIKAIYTHLFDWIVDKINKFIQASSKPHRKILAFTRHTLGAHQLHTPADPGRRAAPAEHARARHAPSPMADAGSVHPDPGAFTHHPPSGTRRARRRRPRCLTSACSTSSASKTSRTTRLSSCASTSQTRSSSSSSSPRYEPPTSPRVQPAQTGRRLVPRGGVLGWDRACPGRRAASSSPQPAPPSPCFARTRPLPSLQPPRARHPVALAPASSPTHP